MATILDLIEAATEGKPVDVKEAFDSLIGERVATLVEDATPAVVKEFFDSLNTKSAE
jgi:hypothetical protein